MLEVVVKGCIGEAEAAAKSRGIVLAGVSRQHEKFNETTLVVAGGCFASVVAWYCEPTQGAPYPVGTCLFLHSRAAVEV